MPFAHSTNGPINPRHASSGSVSRGVPPVKLGQGMTGSVAGGEFSTRSPGYHASASTSPVLPFSTQSVSQAVAQAVAEGRVP